ncbi:hypothetical protein Q8A67_023505 [Cirrhinus molitorella]|uniref:Uncharacterized protein n=1 Tax=Cirrhinus molitorella TaxID=172907 RepID=A0AA88P7N0_9TELE|nr:hypothetical protein Q8A67_023505 [Cirrhinus molitorella]
MEMFSWRNSTELWQKTAWRLVLRTQPIAASGLLCSSNQMQAATNQQGIKKIRSRNDMRLSKRTVIRKADVTGTLNRGSEDRETKNSTRKEEKEEQRQERNTTE